MAGTITKEQVIEALKGIRGPDGRTDIISLGIVSEIVIHGGKVYFSLSAPPDQAKSFEPLRQAAEQAVKRLPGVQSAMVTLTAERASGRSAGNGAGPSVVRSSTGDIKGVSAVKRIIAIASGKGGVGKSTTAVNLALGFQALGLKVGVLDADIYGPSVPRLLRIKGKPEMIGDNTIKPMESYGLKVMSMGFLVDEETPMIWRGPMVMSAITQMLRDVAWGELDLMVVDMPPGTGDAQLTMAQTVPLAGAIIVSTPQDLALIDARKGLNMFKRVNVPVLGIVENMSYFVCPKCGERSDIFAHGGAQSEAARLGVPFLGEVPLDMEIREKSDAGLPLIISAPDSVHARIYKEIAAAAWENASGGVSARQAPKIVIE